MPTGDFKCEVCCDTGYYGDNGPGIKGNTEYHPCDICQKLPTFAPGIMRVDEPVIVIPVAQWRRLVALYQSWMPSCPCDGNCESCEEDREIKAIFASVEVPHD
jgi:hypothetical protein